VTKRNKRYQTLAKIWYRLRLPRKNSCRLVRRSPQQQFRRLGNWRSEGQSLFSLVVSHGSGLFRQIVCRSPARNLVSIPPLSNIRQFLRNFHQTNLPDKQSRLFRKNPREKSYSQTSSSSRLHSRKRLEISPRYGILD